MGKSGPRRPGLSAGLARLSGNATRSACPRLSWTICSPVGASWRKKTVS